MYAIISTIKDEKYISSVIQNVNNQTILPLVWLVYIDEKNKYKRKQIQKEFKISKVKVKFIDFKKCNKEYFVRLANNLHYTFEKLQNLKEYSKIKYILKLDGDILLNKNYCKDLIKIAMQYNYGCISGVLFSYNPDLKKIIKEKRGSQYAMGGGMLINKHILDYLGQYPIVAGSDGALNMTARYLGYKIGSIKTNALQVRLTSSRITMDKQLANAIKQYYLRYPDWFILGVLIYKKKFKQIFQLYSFIIKIKEKERFNYLEIVNNNYRYILKKVLYKLGGKTI